MKILHICTGFPINFQGGITNYVRTLANEQVNSGMNVYVLGGKAENVNEKFQYVEHSSVLIPPFSIGKLEDKEALNKLEKFIKKEKFDLVHIHMMLDLDWNLVEILKYNVKYIISLHDYFFLCPRIIMMKSKKELCRKVNLKKCETCISKFEKDGRIGSVVKKVDSILNLKCFRIDKDIINLRYKNFKNLLENANLLLPVSNRVKEIYEDSGINGKYKVLHIGNSSANNFEKFNKNLYKNNTKIKIVMLGTLSEHKGSDILYKILKNCTNENLEFYFYGRVNKFLQRKFEKVGLKFNGAYKQEQLRDILVNFDLGLVLSIWEDNGPQVVMEMLNNNVPVIGTKMGGITDFVNSKNGYIFDPYNKKELNSVFDFLNNINKKHIIKLKENINRTTTPTEHMEELNKIYLNIIEG